MKVLGISPLDKDSTVSIVEDGNILFAAGEERFSRNKQQSGFPRLALEKALSYTGLSISDFDQVCYPFLTWENEQKLFTKNLEDEKAFIKAFQPKDLGSQIKEALNHVPDRGQPIHGLEHPNAIMEKGFLHNSYYNMAGIQKLASNNAALKSSRHWGEGATVSFQQWETELAQGLSEMGWAAPVKRMDHHLSHAANSFLCSGYERALCVTLDGYGSGLAGSVSEARDGKIHRTGCHFRTLWERFMSTSHPVSDSSLAATKARLSAWLLTATLSYWAIFYYLESSRLRAISGFTKPTTYFSPVIWRQNFQKST